jgi:hypothetical protein
MFQGSETNQKLGMNILKEVGSVYSYQDKTYNIIVSRYFINY